ncbi:MAG: twin-arginine translocase TatA/TatE family subunit [Deltaproteobacteria bacterium]|nr:MAG: twin-arginine translocase TatA/TatE family subunit [Deltaproteobacteria bacterium]
MFGFSGPQELLVILLIILIVFGGKKIPELMGGLGKGVRSFKKGLNETEEEIKQIGEDSEKKKDEEEKS